MPPKVPGVKGRLECKNLKADVLRRWWLINLFQLHSKLLRPTDKSHRLCATVSGRREIAMYVRKKAPRLTSLLTPDLEMTTSARRLYTSDFQTERVWETKGDGFSLGASVCFLQLNKLKSQPAQHAQVRPLCSAFWKRNKKGIHSSLQAYRLYCITVQGCAPFLILDMLSEAELVFFKGFWNSEKQVEIMFQCGCSMRLGQPPRHPLSSAAFLLYLLLAYIRTKSPSLVSFDLRWMR